MKYIKLFENFDSKDNNTKTAEFYKIYFNLYWLCSYFNNVDKFPESKQHILKENKKYPFDKDLKIDDKNLYFNGFPIPLAKNEDDFSSLEISLLNTIEHGDEWDAEKVIGENVSSTVYDKRFNGIYNKVHNLEISVNKLFKDIYDIFYKEKKESEIKNDELLKQTHLEFMKWWYDIMKSIKLPEELPKMVWEVYYKNKPELLEKIFNLWN